MKAFSLVALIVTLFAFGASTAYGRSVKDGGTVNVTAGVPNPVRSVWNCFGRETGATGTAEHGKIVTENRTQNRCGNPKQPVTTVIYTSAPGFVGTDHVYVYSNGSSGTEVDVVVH